MQPTPVSVSPAQTAPADFLLALREKLSKQLDKAAHGIAQELTHRGSVTSDAQLDRGRYLATEYAIRLVDELLDGPEASLPAIAHFKDCTLGPARLQQAEFPNRFESALDGLYRDWIRGPLFVDPVRESRSRNPSPSAARPPKKAAGARASSGGRK